MWYLLLVKGAETVAVDAALRRKVNKKAAIILHMAPTITALDGAPSGAAG